MISISNHWQESIIATNLVALLQKKLFTCNIIMGVIHVFCFPIIFERLKKERENRQQMSHGFFILLTMHKIFSLSFKPNSTKNELCSQTCVSLLKFTELNSWCILLAISKRFRHTFIIIIIIVGKLLQLNLHQS